VRFQAFTGMSAAAALRAIPWPIMPPAPRIATAFIVTVSPVFVIRLVYIETLLPTGAKRI
jgi:hypothetical protein